MGVTHRRAESSALEWTPPERRHRPQIAAILEETGVFRPAEIDVALEVFDDYCDAPGADYWAVGALADRDELTGFAFYGPTPCTVDTWDLYWFAVRPRFQGTGIGRGLLERVEQHLGSVGARICLIETSSRNDYSTTRHFYTACGYREVARVPDFYDEGDDRVVYAKRLTESSSLRKDEKREVGAEGAR